MNFENFCEFIKKIATENENIRAVILVGSYAKGTYNSNSDIDLCILAYDKEKMLSDSGIFRHFGNVTKENIEYYGVVTSLRFFYENSFEVEYGITDMNWISKPLDSGTKRVLRDGHKVIIDKDGYFEEIKSFL